MKLLALLASFALLTPALSRSPASAQDFAPSAVASEESLRVELEGFVYAPDGRPASGAVLVTSAGGTAVAEEDGSFRLETTVPFEAASVQLTAVGRGGGKLVASARVRLPGVSGTVPAGSLWLAQGACQPGWLPTFGQPGVDATVHAMTVFDDGSGPALYAGGEFSKAGGGPARHVARWDGRDWHPLGDGLGAFGGFVRALAVYDDGSGPALYAGGSFTGPSLVAKWNGASWSSLGTGVGGNMNSAVHALAVYDDGSGPALYVGGLFTHAGGLPTSGLAKWNGSAWSTLGSGVSGSLSPPAVYALTVHDDGDGPALYAGGEFTIVSGVSAVRIARWNGIAWAPCGNGLNQKVNALIVHDDGSGSKLYAGCNAFVSRWNGTQWTSLGILTPALDRIVSALAVWDDGSGPALYAGGTFTTVAGVPANSIAKWNGSSWSALESGTESGIRALTVFDPGTGAELHAGGAFTSAGTVGARFLARWNGAAWRMVSDGLDDDVFGFTSVAALEVFDDGSGPALHAAGSFEFAGGTVVNSIVRWTGSSWEGLGGGVTKFGSPGEVCALAAFDDGSGPALYAGGEFTHAGGIPAGRVARWKGSGWSAAGSGFQHPVLAFAVFHGAHGDTLYAGGAFQTESGSVGVARWTGSSWVGLGSGVSGSIDPWQMNRVLALAAHDDGSGPAIYAGGHFLAAGGTPANFVARWNGTSWSALGSGLNNNVLALAVHDDGSGPALYAGGLFTSAGGISASRIARWNGTSWSALGSGTNDAIQALASFDDGCGPALCAGGYFTLAGGSAANGIAEWDGTSWTALGSGLVSGFDEVKALKTCAVGPGAALYAGGSFARAPDSGDSFLARWGFDTTAPTLTTPPAVFRIDRLGTPPGEIVTFSVTAEDDVDPAPVVTCVPASGSLFPVGTTVVTCTATDGAGNLASSEFPVTVGPKMRQRDGSETP